MNYSLLNRRDSRLRQKCAEVTDFSNVDEVLEAMHEIMENEKAYGISAPQIGDNRRIPAVAAIESWKPISNNRNGDKISIIPLASTSAHNPW